MKNSVNEVLKAKDLEAELEYITAFDYDDEAGSCKLDRKNNFTSTLSAIDYLKVTTIITENDAKNYTNRLKKLSKEKWRSEGFSHARISVKNYEFLNIVSSTFNTSQERGYSYGYSIYAIGSEFPLCVYFKNCSTKNGNVTYLVLQINPNKHSINSMLNLRKAIRKIFGSTFFKHMANFNVNRYDTCYDIANLEISQLFYTHKNPQVFSANIGRDGNMETINHGQKNNGLCIYNKKRQIVSNNKKKYNNPLKTTEKQQVPKSETTRFEFRKSPKKLTLDKLLWHFDFPSLDDIDFYKTGSTIKIDKVFMALAKVIGLQAALKFLDTKERAAAKKTLKSCKIEMHADSDELQHSIDLIDLLTCTTRSRRQRIIDKYSKNQRDYIHTGIVNRKLLILAGVANKPPSNEQRNLLMVKGNVKSALGHPISRQQALLLIKLGEENTD